MFTCLRHRAISRTDNKNGTIHLSSARNHVLDKVSMPWAVNMSIVTLFGLIFDVTDSNGHRFRFISNGSTLCNICVALGLSQILCRLHGDKGTGERRFPMVNVPDRADVHVGFCSLKSILSHALFLGLSSLKVEQVFLACSL